MTKTLNELNLSDDFLFAKVMSDKDICKEFLGKLLEIKIEKVTMDVEYMTLLERDREKIEEGRQEGIKEGIKEAVSKLLLKGKSETEIAELLDIDLEMVNEVKERVEKSR